MWPRCSSAARHPYLGGHEGRCRAVVCQPLNNTHAWASEKGGKGFQVVDLADEANGVKDKARFELEKGFFRQDDPPTKRQLWRDEAGFAGSNQREERLPKAAQRVNAVNQFTGEPNGTLGVTQDTGCVNNSFFDSIVPSRLLSYKGSAFLIVFSVLSVSSVVNFASFGLISAQDPAEFRGCPRSGRCAEGFCGRIGRRGFRRWRLGWR